MRYCTCERPYPDAERPDVSPMMYQCVVCEDWFHTEVSCSLEEKLEKKLILQHMELAQTANIDTTEFACGPCTQKLPFLAKVRFASTSNTVSGVVKRIRSGARRRSGARNDAVCGDDGDSGHEGSLSGE